MSYYLPVDVTILVTYWEDLNYNNESQEYNYTITKTFIDYDEFMSSIKIILKDNLK